MRARPATFARRSDSPAVLIIADDLTGAADSAVACVTRGLSAVVRFGRDSSDAGAEALSLDTDTRAITPQDAAAITADVVARHGGRADTLLFKKIDSTLRGHPGAEIAAALQARHRQRITPDAPRGCVILAPTFPTLGRTTVAGCQLLDGAPLEQTELWRREGMGGTARLPDLMAAAGLATALAPLADVRAGPAALRARIGAQLQRADIVVCDAETDADIADATWPLAGAIWAGSAGLVGHLVAAAGLARPPAPVAVSPARCGPLLFVVGSLSPISHRQAARLARENVATLRVDASLIDDAPGAARFAAAWDDALASGRDILVQTADDTRLAVDQAAALRAEIASRIAASAPRIRGLFATGGETARAILSAMGVSTLRILGEVQSGVPVSVAAGPRAWLVVTKAGAFGDCDTMIQSRLVMQMLSAASTESVSFPEECK